MSKFSAFISGDHGTCGALCHGDSMEQCAEIAMNVCEDWGDSFVNSRITSDEVTITYRNHIYGGTYTVTVRQEDKVNPFEHKFTCTAFRGDVYVRFEVTCHPTTRIDKRVILANKILTGWTHIDYIVDDNDERHGTVYSR